MTKRGKPMARITPGTGPERIDSSVTLVSDAADDDFSTGESSIAE